MRAVLVVWLLRGTRAEAAPRLRGVSGDSSELHGAARDLDGDLH